MKYIVSHLSPDLDSITSCWLIKRFLPGWKKAKIILVPAGSTLNNKPPDENPEIIHVDTGMGRFDHHQTNDNTCAAKKVFEHLIEKKYIKQSQMRPLERIVEFVNLIDHFQEVYFPQPRSDHYDFSLHQIIEGLKSVINDDDKIIETVFILLDGVFQIFINKIRAEEELKKAFIFNTKWGKALAVESKNEETIKLALKMGFKLAIRKNPEKGFVRIKSLPEKKIDLTPLYQKIKTLDKKGTWFLHSSKNMLLNSSSKNPHFIPTSLSLPKLIEVIKSL